MIMKARVYKIGRVGGQVGDHARSQCCSSSPEPDCLRIPCCSWEVSPLLEIFRSSADWMRVTHIMEDNVLYLKSASLNVKSYPKTLTESMQNNV